jgi:hypothetical protein
MLDPTLEMPCLINLYMTHCRLCGLVVILPGYRPRGPEFDSRRYQIFCVTVDLERGPLSPCEDK